MKTIAKIPAELSLVVSQGADFVLELSVLENGDPYSFVGATVAPEIMFLDHTTHPVNFSFAVASNVLTLTLSDANTTALGSDSFLWRVTVTKGGDSSDWVAGVLSIVPPGQGGKSPAASATLSLSTAPTVELSIAGGVTGPQGVQGIQGPQGESAQREARSDWVSPNSYLGIAAEGSSESASVWRVTRITVTGNTVTTAVASPIRWVDRLTAVYV